MKDRKTKKEKIKSQQRLKKQRELKKLKLEAEELKKQIEKQKRINQRNVYIKNLRIFGKICSYTAPYVLCAGLSINGIKLLGGGYPIIKDDTEKYKQYKLEYQTDKLVNAEESYESWLNSEISDNQIKIYSPWILNYDETYSRTITTYTLKKCEISDFYYAVLEQDIDYIEEWGPIFCTPKVETEITTKEQEINNDEYLIEANLNILDKTDVLKVEESDTKNALITLFNILIPIIVGRFINRAKSNTFKKSIQKIKENYKTQSLEPLNKKLSEVEHKILVLNKEGRN